jgi:predicted small lipoprotein YifL
MLRVLGLALLVMTLAACGDEAPTREPATAGEPTTAEQSSAVEMFKDPT